MSLLYTKTRPSQQRVPGSWWSNTADFWTSDSKYGRSLYENLADELYPTGLSFPELDVVNNFQWTLTPTKSEARKEAPYIILREFLQLETQLNQCLLPYGKPAVPAGNFFASINETDIFPSTDSFTKVDELLTPINTDTDALYKGLFDHINPTYFKYKLPYFTPEYFSVNNTWEATDILDKIIEIQSNIGGAIRAMVKGYTGTDQGLGKFLQNLPATYKKLEIFNIQAGNPAVGLMDAPRVWKNSTNRTYSFEFPLYNIDTSGSSNSENLIQKNWEFCFLLTYQNMINKRNFYTAIPPVFYEVLIPGVHYCKASYISDLTIQNLGNIRRLQLPIAGSSKSDVNVPDAYSIKITLTDLLQPSKNLLQSVTDTNYRSQIQAGNSRTGEGI